MNHFYVYLIRCRRREWWYVGKGHGDRWWGSYKRYDGVDYTLLVVNISSEEALAVEEAVIAAMRLLGFKLYNKAERGSGGMLGRKHSEGAKEKIRVRRLGSTHSEATLREMRGRIVSSEEREKISRTMRGTPLSAEHKSHLSEALSGRVLTTEWKDKISQSKKGVSPSEETREKIRQKAIERYKKRKI